MTTTTTTGSGVERVLAWSLVASAVSAAAGLIWGITSGSGAILFDGLFSALSLLTLWLALRATRLLGRPEDDRFQFGFRHLEPLVVALRALALVLVSCSAAAASVASILRGGQSLDQPSVLAFALFTLALAGGMLAWERRVLRRQPSVTLHLDAQEWLLSALLSAGILAGWLGAHALEEAGHERLARLIDPLLVLVVVGAVVRLPLRLLPGAMRDVLLIAPEAEVQARFQAVVAAEAAAAGLPRWKLHLARLGEGFDVELNFLVAPDFALPASALDQLRGRLEAGFGLPPHRLWLTVTFTAEARWT
jgi:predicted Co/Zn/Cd cation transporter (cation efflux family)